MNAGRELDALVCTKVIGKTVVKAADVWERLSKGIAPTYAPMHVILGIKKDDLLIEGTDELWPYKYCPPYSTDIAAAWEVMNAMYESTGFQEITIRRFSEGDGWEVVVGRIGSPSAIGSLSGSEVNWEGVAECAPLVICRAALKAVGVEG